jgi:mannose-1-phosphate guanylyltransferase/phosphomannomutase
VEDLARASGLTVTRTKSDGRSLVAAAKNKHVQLAASMQGHFIFPSFHANFDGLFTVAKTLELLARTDQSLGATRRSIPRRAYHQVQIPCSLELKGGIMRKMSEDSVDHEASFIDGVKVHFDDGWVLMLPDQHQPVAHVIAESSNPNEAQRLVEEYRRKVETWKKELATA